MSVNIVVPELSESVIEATVSNWLKKEGDAVQAGEAVVVLETDKVALEVAAEQPGVLSQILHPAGDDVKPGDVLGVLAETGEAVAVRQEAAPTAAAKTATAPPVASVPTAGIAATPVARRVAAAHDVDLARVSPAAGGKVTKTDVQNFISTPPKAATPPPPIAAANGSRQEERVRMSRRRQTIAQRLLDVQQTAAMLTTFNEVDMKAVMDLRKRRKDGFQQKFGISLGLSSFFVKATIGALKVFPRLNAEIQGNEIVLKHYYDIGIAVGAEEGLVVPVLRDADRMSFAEIEKAVRDYAKQVENSTLSIEALRGGTFTITNGGIFGSLLSTPILNPPQVGILGLHGIKERPVVINGEIVARPMMYLALTYDHRIVDGREAVQFLVRIKDLIEDPETLLIEG